MFETLFPNIIHFLFSLSALAFWSLPVLWLVRQVKAINVWLYLWQLKEYHIGRFIDHFRTTKGKKLVCNKAIAIKFLFFLIFISQAIYFVFAYPLDKIVSRPDIVEDFLPFLQVGSFIGLFGMYSFEAYRGIRNFIKRLYIPVFTKKIIFLFFIGITVQIFLPLSLFLTPVFASIFPDSFKSFTAGILMFFALGIFVDLATPIIVSAIVLIFQPFAMLGKRHIIAKAKQKRANLKNLKVVGITGSYGKTSTKEFLFTILQEKFRVLKTPEHRNSEIGISQTILNDLKEDHQIFICEMGAYNKGGVKLLAEIAQPQIAILTGANEQHLALFGSMENLLSAEGGGELVETLPENGTVIINGYSEKLKTQIPRLRQTYSGQVKLKKFIVAGEDMRAANVRVEKENIYFEVDGVQFQVSVCGGHNVQNLSVAIAAARELGMGLKEIAEACEKITQDMGAMKLRKGINGLNIINATYSANPDGVIAALEYLKLWEGKKVIVMPCLIELGMASEQVHKKIGQKIGEVCDLAIIVTKDKFQAIKEGMAQGKAEVVYSENPQAIFEKVRPFTVSDNVLLLEGRIPQQIINQFVEKP